MFFFGVFLLAFLFNSQLVLGACSVHTVNDTFTADPPVYDSTDSGFKANDVLTLIFTWPTYGAVNRTIDAANSGFVSFSNNSVLCSSHLLSSGEGSVNLNDASCTDNTTQRVPWSTAKSDCGNDFFPSTNIGDPILFYNVNFRYRITYLEALSNGDTRTVQSDFSFVVSTPTQFTVNSTLFNLQGTTTFITNQKVTSDATGAINVTVTVVTDCSTSVAVTDVAAVGTPGATITGFSQPVFNSSPITGTGTQFDGLCRSAFVVALLPSVANAVQCNINGVYNFSYTLTFADASTWDTSATVQLTSSDTCSTITIMSNPPTFSLTLFRQADHLSSGGALSSQSTVSYHSTAYWQLVLTPPLVNSAPTPDDFTTETIAWSSDGVVWNNVSSLGAISFADGGNNFPANNYNFSFVWEPSAFTVSGLLYIRTTFYITYPATTTGLNTKKRMTVTNAVVPIEQAVRRLHETMDTRAGYIEAHSTMQVPQIVSITGKGKKDQSNELHVRQSLNIGYSAVSKPLVLASDAPAPATTSSSNAATTSAATAAATTTASAGTDSGVIIGAVVGAVGGAVVVSLAVVGVVWWMKHGAAASAAAASPASSSSSLQGVEIL